MVVDVYDTAGNHLGDLVITKTKLIWCKGRTKPENGKAIKWRTFIEQMESLDQITKCTLDSAATANDQRDPPPLPPMKIHGLDSVAALLADEGYFFKLIANETGVRFFPHSIEHRDASFAKGFVVTYQGRTLIEPSPPTQSIP